MKAMRWFLALLVVALAMLPGTGMMASAQGATTKITIIHFSDYHSHAVPFYSEGAPNQAGIARTIAYIKSERKINPNTLVLDGGDMFNKGSPTWSDEYKCAEWPWLKGLVDAMALGNHDFDYGQDTFKSCMSQVDYPTLSANYLGADGKPLLTASDGKPYLVKTVGGVKLGLFALAGSDFASLITKTNLSDGATFADRTATAKQIVATLRDTEKVDAVILFGHATREDDTALAQAVPGIDLVLGTHSHFKGAFTKIEGTNTYYISPFQYLTYLSQVEMSFSGGKLVGVSGQLVKMDQSKPEDPTVASQVAQMQKDLEAKYPDRFKVLGNAAVELNADNIDLDETVLGNWSMDFVRAAAGTNAFFSTSSSFRASIPPGPITVEAFFAAIPYKNSIVTSEMTGQQLADLVNVIVSKRGSDNFCQESGVRFKMQDGKATDIQVLVDPSDATMGYAPLDRAKTYKVGATNFMTGVSAIYKPLFAQAANVVDTKQDIGTLLTDTIQKQGTVTGAVDGRMGSAPAAQPTATTTPVPPPVVTPAPGGGVPGMPSTGSGGNADAWPVSAMLLALSALAGGFAVRRRASRG